MRPDPTATRTLKITRLMPTLMTTLLQEPVRLRALPNRRRHTDLWRLLCLLIGFCFGWILRTHLIG
jgi:hypothetical protein